MEASIGRTVHYLAGDGYQGLTSGQKYPAVIVEVGDGDVLTLSVFTKSQQFPIQVINGVSLDDAASEKGTWSWPKITVTVSVPVPAAPATEPAAPAPADPTATT
jgi:hypothetical protein